MTSASSAVQQAIEAAKAPAQDAVQKGIEAISSYVSAAKDMDWNRIAELTGNASLDSNIALVYNNVCLAAKVAAAMNAMNAEPAE